MIHSWQFEHTAMLVAVVGLLIYEAYKVGHQGWRDIASGLTQKTTMTLFRVKQSQVILSIIISQAPWWIGSTVWFYSTIENPLQANLLMNPATGLLFIFWGHRTGHAFMAVLALLFAIATMIDIYTAIFGSASYVLFQEAIHYAALLAIGGRSYATNLHSWGRSRLYPDTDL